MINDILDFSKIEAGKVEIEDVEFSVQTIVDSVVDLLVRTAEAKGLELVASVDGSVPTTVIGDPARVRQVLINLIGNAIKFTQAGHIAVRATRTESVGADSVLRFEVSDTGDGIPADKLDLIFHPFVQADMSTSRKFGGTGLGLSISGQLIGLMGGSCGVSSEIEVGSTFWFTIKVGTDPAQATHGAMSPDVAPTSLSTRSPSDDGDSGGSRLLLLAEDNLINQKVAAGMLSSAGYQVDTVVNGAEAVEAVADGAYDAVLMDCQMPDLNGYEATAAIRALKGPGRMVPIIGVTAGARQEDRRRCLDAGMDAYISKPVIKEALVALVDRVVKRRSVS